MDSVGLNKGLGWFSIALGLVEIAGGRRIAEGIGARRQAGLVRGYGVREIATGVGLDGTDRAVDVAVTRLRRKIEQDPKAPRHLVTVRGEGYMLKTGSDRWP